MEARIAELRAQRDELSRRLSDQEAGVRAAEEARRRAEISLALDDARLRELDAETQRLTEREVDLAARRTQLDAALAAAEKSETEAAARLEKTSAAGADERAGLMAAEQRAGRSREVLRDAEMRSRAAEVRAMEARLHLEQTREQLLVELAGIGADGLTTLRGAAGLDTMAEGGERATDQQADAQVMEAELSQLMERWQTEPPREAPPSPNRLAALRRRFHELGAGNPFAAQEYAELRERLEALEAQHADMEAAIVATRDLIASLNAMIHDQFRSTFAALEGAFSRRFEELFGGGDAQLSLTAPDDLTVTGVEIHARPPGKRRQPLSMLSGGERALTAVSLLMAMLEVRPVPFCVLDEVDAALDEANIGRFSKALRGLAEHTQFIVITHTRGTIEAADALYGVTIGDDAVSRVVSLRLPGTSGNGDARGDRLAEMAAS
jgi:chromosome segregation protein